MFGLGAMEVVVILLLALIVLGPEKLPEVARKMARFAGELRRVSDEVRRNFDEASKDVRELRNPALEAPKPRPAPVQSIAQNSPPVPPEVAATPQAATVQPANVTPAQSPAGAPDAQHGDGQAAAASQEVAVAKPTGGPTHG